MNKTKTNQNNKKMQGSITKTIILLFALVSMMLTSYCNKESAAQKVYVAPGEKDKFYAFFSGGYSGHVTVHGLPSARLIKTIPVFAVFPENGYGIEEETKDILMTTHGHMMWDDSHHTVLSLSKGEQDGKWLFINGNNVPRIARIDLSTFETKEIIEIPNSAGNHASPFTTENSEYLMAATRFSIPIPQKSVPIKNFGEGSFKGSISLVKVDPNNGHMSIDLQIIVPGFNYDLSNCGKKASHDWCFFSAYNTEQAWKMMEIEASRNDKDFVLALNWVKALSCKAKSKPMKTAYYHNIHPENNKVKSTKLTSVNILDPIDCPGALYYLPTPKSPHGTDVDPSGNYIVAGGKLSALIPVHSFAKLQKAIKDKSNIIKTIEGIPVLKYESTLYGEVQAAEKKAGKKFACLGPLHTQFDNKGRAFTSCFLSSNALVWDVKTLKVLDSLPSYYNIGHLVVPGGSTAKPSGKYLVTMNKLTIDRYLPTGMEMAHSAQLYDISGAKGELLLDFPTMGEPHGAEIIPADKIAKNSARFFPLEENKHPYSTVKESEARVVRDGTTVHVYLTAQLTHFRPDEITIKKGDTAYFHVTNLTQKFDIPHGFAIHGAPVSNILIMPGQTKTVKWVPKKEGIYPFYCTDFCSALHQEMQNYIRVLP